MTANKRRRKDTRRKPGRRSRQARRPAAAAPPPPKAAERSSILPAVLAPLAAGLVSVAVASFFFIDLDGRDAPEPPQVAALAPAAPAPGQPPDLSTMTPREAADRLYNRIMMASEQGRPEEAQRFVPMALAAYGQLGSLDADAHYHLGRIHAEAGDFESVRVEIDAMRRLAPDHLLAAVLEHLVAEAAGDSDAMARAYATFAAAYDAEMAAGRPEYEHHRITIDQFRVASYGVRPEVQVSED